MAMKIDRIQRSAQAAQPAAEQRRPESEDNSPRQANRDTVEIGVRVREELSPEDKKLQDKLSAVRSMRQMLESVRQQSAQMAEQSEKQSKAMKESLDKMKRCSKIAKNIQKGHKVPPKDEKYLLENDPKLYMMAMALRMLEDPDNKKVKSELKKEEEEQQNETAAPGVEGVEGAAPPDVAVEMGADVSVE